MAIEHMLSTCHQINLFISARAPKEEKAEITGRQYTTINSIYNKLCKTWSTFIAVLLQIASTTAMSIISEECEFFIALGELIARLRKEHGII